MTTPERLVFSQSVEALLIRGVGARMTPQLEDRLRRVGIDLRRLLPAYSQETWERAVEVVAKELYPDLPMGEAQWKLGESTVYGWGETMLGKAMFALSKVIGPKRALQRFPSMSRASNNYSTMLAHELSPNEFELICEPFAGWPEYVQGCLRAVIDVTGAKEPKVELVEHDRARERIVMRATWQS